MASLTSALVESRRRWPHLNSRDAKRAAVLIRRQRYLEGLAGRNEADDWDKQEAAALAWVLEYVDVDLQRRDATYQPEEPSHA